MEEYLTPRQAAEKKGVSVATIYKAIERGQLPAVRVLDRVALRVADVEAYQPGSYWGVQRAVRRRGPGRGKKEAPSHKPPWGSKEGAPADEAMIPPAHEAEPEAE